jgi:hypothetical protein
MATITENNTATDTNFDDKHLPFPHAEYEAAWQALVLLQEAFAKFPDEFWWASECWRSVNSALAELGDGMWYGMNNLWTEKPKDFRHWREQYSPPPGGWLMGK